MLDRQTNDATQIAVAASSKADVRDKTSICPYEQQYKQVYGYTLDPNEAPKHAKLVKVGDTDQDVEYRIRQQAGTLGFNTITLFTRRAQQKNGRWFRDTELHRFFEQSGIHKKDLNQIAREWFDFGGDYGRAEQLTDQFINLDYSEVQQPCDPQDYTLREEQQRAVNETLDYQEFSDDEELEFLWNAKPRFGKTLTAYDFAIRSGARKILIVTNRPAIANSWFDDFQKFIATKYPKYKFVSETDALKDKAMTHDEYVAYYQKHIFPNPSHFITFLSLQDIKGAQWAGGQYDKLEWVKNPGWDLLVIDEAHEGIDTGRTDEAFDQIVRDFTLHLSGTPFRAIALGKFADEQIFNWSYLDEQKAKKQWDDPFEHNPYVDLPKLNLFTYQMSNIVEGEIKQGTQILSGESVDYAFDLNEFFKTKPNGDFEHEESVQKFLDNLCSGHFPFSPDEHADELNHTFWLLHRVASVKALERLLKRHHYFKNYRVIIAAGDGKSLSVEADDFESNDASLCRVRKSIEENEKTITLSVGQLTTGVTIPEWTAVFMLNNIESPSLYFQAAFRAQNPHTYTCDQSGSLYRKERAYVFDFAPERTLELFEQFAGDLQGGVAFQTPNERAQMVKELLNFFPVIGEDKDGTMHELDPREVLEIPNRIKSGEVIRRGFMSNLLFANISNIFGAPEELREILNKIKPEKNKKLANKKNITAQNPMVDDEGNVEIPNEIVINKTKAIFGDKIYDTSVGAGVFVHENAKIVAQDISKEWESAFETIKDEYQLNKGQLNEIQNVAINAVAQQATEAIEAFEGVQQAIEQSRDEQLKDAATPEQKQEIAQVAEQELALAAESYHHDLQRRLEKVATNTVEQQIVKVEEKKKSTEESEVRDHLRGFARTIPSFLMAYGTPETTLATFEENIDPATFEELTSITIDDFRKLRDGFEYTTDEGEVKVFKGFFDEVVFNASIRAFFDKKAELANCFDEDQTEDIFDYILPQETNQIFTPKTIVKTMVDLLEEENPDIFKSRETRFINLYIKSGTFLTEIARRLNAGLADEIPDREERLKWILENQVYGVAPSNIIYNIAKNYIFGGVEGISTNNIVEWDLVPNAKEGTVKEKLAELFGEDMKFDVVIGNPPYQEKAKGTSTGDDPIYHRFYEEGFEIAEKVMLITPARFLFNAGKTPKLWNKKMLSDPHVKVVYFAANAKDVFPAIGFKGGVAVVYRDRSTNFGEIGAFYHYPELNSLVSKVHMEESFRPITDIIYTQTKFDLEKLYQDYPNYRELIGSKGKDRRVRKPILARLDIFTDSAPDEPSYRILGRVSGQRVFKYVPKKYIADHENINKYKVIVPSSNGTGAIGEVLSTPLIGFTDTFISFGAFTVLDEAKAVFKYVKSRFARTLLGTLKITQDNNRDTWANVPMQDFTSNSDIDWSQSISEIDQQLYRKYELSEEEIAFIESKVQPME